MIARQSYRKLLEIFQLQEHFQTRICEYWKLKRNLKPILHRPPPHTDDLYFGKFTKEEYEDAKKIIQEQISKLEGQIKGDYNVRENLGKFSQFPEPASQDSKPVKVENLSDFFRQTIKLTGPIPLSTYMRQCLTHPEFGIIQPETH